MPKSTLKFGKANAKLKALEELTGKKVQTFSMLAGHTCPFAKDCLSKVVIQDGKRKIQDGPDTEFRCFSASQEALYTNVYEGRKHNKDLMFAVRDCEDKLTALLSDSLPNKKREDIIRIHVSGDFFNQNCFDAWLNLANLYPHKVFYAYTKSIKYWTDRKDRVAETPNFILTASYGGRQDSMIEENGFRSAKVIWEEDILEKIVASESYDRVPNIGSPYDGLRIDHNDNCAYDPSIQHEDFALLVHGVQAKGSEAQKSVKLLNGKGSYGDKSK